MGPGALIVALNTVIAAQCGILPPLWKLAWRILLPLALFMIPIVLLILRNLTAVGL
jgi:hypothetical protein